tara:strand:- start:26728 stop:27060 length:333 start_codon:yes stop_codon:yes gene_type:complete
MSFVRGIIVLILTLVVAGFAAINTDPVSVMVSPINDPVMVPLYQVALASVALGFIAGALIVWINCGPVRQSKRQQKKEIKNLEKEVNRLQSDKFSPRPPAPDVFPALPSQ